MPRGMFNAHSAFAALVQIRPSKLRSDFRIIRLFTVEALQNGPLLSLIIGWQMPNAADSGRLAKKLAKCTETARAMQS